MIDKVNKIPDFFIDMFHDLGIEPTDEQKCVALQYSDEIHRNLETIGDHIKSLRPRDALGTINICKLYMGWKIGNATLRLMESVMEGASDE